MYPWRHNMVWREGCETRPMVSGRTWGLFGVGERHRMVGCGGGCVCFARVVCEGRPGGGRGTSTNLAVQGPNEKGWALLLAGGLG